MKKLFYLFGVLTLLIGCNQKYNKSEFKGTWDLVSSMNVESGEVELSKIEDKVFVEIQSDSLYLGYSGSEDACAWHIEGDSLILEEFVSVYIKNLTSDTLKVEYDLLGKVQLTFKKRSN